MDMGRSSWQWKVGYATVPSEVILNDFLNSNISHKIAEALFRIRTSSAVMSRYLTWRVAKCTKTPFKSLVIRQCDFFPC